MRSWSSSSHAACQVPSIGSKLPFLCAVLSGSPVSRKLSTNSSIFPDEETADKVFGVLESLRYAELESTIPLSCMTLAKANAVSR